MGCKNKSGGLVKVLFVAAISLSDGWAKGVFKELLRRDGDADGLLIDVRGLLAIKLKII